MKADACMLSPLGDLYWKFASARLSLGYMFHRQKMILARGAIIIIASNIFRQQMSLKVFAPASYNYACMHIIGVGSRGARGAVAPLDFWLN